MPFILSRKNASYSVKARSFFFLLFIILQTALSYASPTLEEAKQKALDLNLAESQIWRKLLHFEPGSHQSSIITDGYFFSPQGKTDPQAELLATIEAFYADEKRGDKGREDSRCLFPARYYWLSKHIPIPEKNLRDATCMVPERWRSFDSIKSISVLMVSGYWGNPASTFGHTILRLNTKDANEANEFFDLTVNYGAETPANENPLVYVYKGLTGGYLGVFSDQYFYTQDLTYTRTEFRDIWDYELELSDEGRTLLIYHIWEITGRQFKYYFLNRNCAYQLARLIEIGLPEPILDRYYPWYIPEEMLFKLQDMGHLKSVRYIPSNKRFLFYEILQLDPQELKVFNTIVRNGRDKMPGYLEQLDTGSRIKVLNSLLAYEKYRLISERKSPEELQEVKDAVLLERLKLPARKEPPLNIPQLPAATDGSRPAAFKIGTGFQREGDPFMKLGWSPYIRDLVGQNNLDGNEFMLFDLELGFFQEKQDVFLDKLDIIRVVNLETMPIEVINEGTMSWEMRLGIDRLENDNQNDYDATALFGAGRAIKFNEVFKAYGMVDMAGHTIEPYARLRPYLALEANMGKLKAWVMGGYETDDYGGGLREIWGAKMKYRLQKRYSLDVELSNERATQTTVGLSLYW